MLFQKSGSPIRWHFSLGTRAFCHFHLHLLKQTENQGVQHLLETAKPWKEAPVKLWLFIPDRRWPVESSEFWQKHKINWVSSKSFFGFQDPLINLRWKFFSPTEAQEGNRTLWFLTLSCNWGGIFIDQLLTGSAGLSICISSRITW